MADLWDAPAIVRAYLKTGNENLRRAAREAAGSFSWFEYHSRSDDRASAIIAEEASRAAFWATDGGPWLLFATKKALEIAKRHAARNALNIRELEQSVRRWDLELKKALE